MRLAGVGPGDEVITTPYSFVASANCAIYEGATPVFADIDARTYNLDPAAVEAAVTPRTKAVVAVDVFGYPCELDELRAVCDRHGLAFVEDACEALGARYKGRPLGSHGHPATFAFYPNKQVTTGEGGAVTTASRPSTSCSSRSATRAGSRRRAGSSTAGSGSTTGSTTSRPRSGPAQLERLDRILAARGEVAARYAELLAGLDLEVPLADDDDHVRSWFVYVVRLPRGVDRDGLILRHGRARRRLRAVPAFDPPPAVHARALRLRRGPLPGERGLQRADDGAPVPRAPRARGPGARRRGAPRPLR